MPETLTSVNNPLLKEVRRAARQGGLTSTGLALAEGPHLLEEALRSRVEIFAIVAAEPARLPLPPDLRVLHVTPEAFSKLSTTESSQGLLTLVRPRLWESLPGHSLTVVLDGVQEPGNAGAILRAAEAFGASGVLFRKGSVNPYNPKCIRASAGSIFRLPVICSQDLPPVPLYAADARASLSLSSAVLSAPCALIIGSEGRGITPELAARATGLRIPTRAVESLNAAVAAGILLYEAARQRSQ